MTATQPELYWAKPTAHCPNSKLPVLVYRNVLPSDLSIESTTKACEANQWVKGGVFKHFPTAHFHSNTHECYAAIKGRTKWVISTGSQVRYSTRLMVAHLYGVGPLDEPTDGIEFEMQAGDIAVHAAGVAHRNVESSEDYTYVGLYPKGAPHWDNNYCKDDLETTAVKAKQAGEVSIPEFDPVFGQNGPLPTIWKGVVSGDAS